MKKLKYNALTHRNGTIVAECTECGKIHRPGEAVQNDCANCKQIAESTILADEAEKHQQEIIDVMNGKKFNCKHYALTIDKERN